MTATAYDNLWNIASDDMLVRMNQIAAALKSNPLFAKLDFKEPTLEIDCVDFHALLVVWDKGLGTDAPPVVVVSLALVDCEDETFGFKLEVEYFQPTDTGLDYGGHLSADWISGPVLAADSSESDVIAALDLPFDSAVSAASRTLTAVTGMTDLQRELTRRATRGFQPSSVKQIEETLAKLGYKLDRSSDSKSITKILRGAGAGENYPVINTCVVQADDGKSFAHYQSRRDENFDKLQKLRFNASLFAVLNDVILDI